ncbi:MAG: hypothetical protein QOG41_1588, partial [Thermoleophilaceae bacterium]|nr:hypothetical protein [Thermoleophilaceae bacterium]
EAEGWEEVPIDAIGLESPAPPGSTT